MKKSFNFLLKVARFICLFGPSPWVSQSDSINEPTKGRNSYSTR